MRFLGIFSIAFCAIVPAVQAQPRFQTTFSFSMGFPQGEFGDNVDNTGLGLNAGFNYRIGHSPVLIGASFGFLQYGSVSRSTPLSPDIPELIVEVDTSNNILAAHFLTRYEFGKYESRIKPYVEGLVGLHYLWTQTSIDESDEPISSTNFDDTTGSLGAGGGLLIGLHHPAAGSFRFDLELGARWLSGGDASYLTEGSIIRENGNVTYLVTESSTNLFITNFGVVFSF
jgi:Outer membrane protein beta-barrel domain